MVRSIKLQGMISLLVASALSAGCASIATGGKQTLSLDSDPSGAQVIFQGSQLGQTPTQVSVPRQREGVLLTLRKPGYHDATVQPGQNMSGWVLGNVILGGVIGTTVDVATGSSVEYAPDHFFVALTPDEDINHASSAFVRPVSERAELKSYMLVAFNPIVDDVLLGQGRHLDTLLKRLSVPAIERAQAIAKLQSIVTLSEGDAMSFSNMVLHHFKLDAPAAEPKPVATPAPDPTDNWFETSRSTGPKASAAPTATPRPRNYF